ncbi:cellular nucleic acid-binding protein, partial [Trifolium medium]|nr:cellular nucleic acid-binding protein [Trifolium medium]
FATLVDKSRICDDDGKAKTSYYKALSDRRGKGQDRGKPYDNRGKKGVESGGGRKKNSGQCYKYGKWGHKSEVCRAKVTCFNCCKKPRKVMGKVFALSGEDAN